MRIYHPTPPDVPDHCRTAVADVLDWLAEERAQRLWGPLIGDSRQADHTVTAVPAEELATMADNLRGSR